MRRTIVATLLLAALAMAAPASAGERADFELRFAEQALATPTRWTLHLRYKAPGDPDAKPYAIRQLSLRLPAGTRFNAGTHPSCDATDEEIRLLGDSACPPESRIGSGRLTVMSGFGPPFDPYATNLSLFSTRDGMIEVLKDARFDVVVAIERLKLSDGALTLTPAVVPGGPPDWKMAARDIDWDMAAGWLATPPDCPASGRWTSTGTFTFDDGATATETATTPCPPPPAATPKKARKSKRCRRPARRQASRTSAKPRRAARRCTKRRR